MERLDLIGQVPELQEAASLSLVGESLSTEEIAEELDYAERESTPTLLKRTLTPGEDGMSLGEVSEELEGEGSPLIHQIFSPGTVGTGISPEDIMEELESDTASEIAQLFTRGGGGSSGDLAEELGFLARQATDSPDEFQLSGIGSNVTVVVGDDSGKGSSEKHATPTSTCDLPTCSSQQHATPSVRTLSTAAAEAKGPSALKVIGRIVQSDPVSPLTVVRRLISPLSVAREARAKSEPRSESDSIIEELESTLSLSNEESELTPYYAGPPPSRVGRGRVIVGKHTAPRKPGAPYLSPRKTSRTQEEEQKARSLQITKSRPKIWQPWKV